MAEAPMCAHPYPTDPGPFLEACARLNELNRIEVARAVELARRRTQKATDKAAHRARLKEARRG